MQLCLRPIDHLRPTAPAHTTVMMTLACLMCPAACRVIALARVYVGLCLALTASCGIVWAVGDDIWGNPLGTGECC